MKKLRNALTWFEIPAFHLGRAKIFYETVFDITLEEMTINTNFKMAIFPVEKGTIGGAYASTTRFTHQATTAP